MLCADPPDVKATASSRRAAPGSPSPELSERAVRIAIGTLALAGAAVAGYLTYVHYAHAQISCATGGCETVLSSRYAEVLGVPVAVLGLGAYLALLATAVGRGEPAGVASASLALSAFGFSSYLVYVQLVVIGAVCQWCVASDLVTTAITALALARLVPFSPRRQVETPT